MSSSPTAMAAAKTAITMKSSLSRIIAAKRNRALKAAELPPPFEAWKIIRGDKVEITAGKDKGKQGEVMKVFRRNQRVMVQGLNLAKKHLPKMGSSPGKIITKPMPIHLSNVAHIDPTTGSTTRVKFGYLGDGTKVRIAVKSGAIIPKSDILKQRRNEAPDGGTRKDTQRDSAIEVTASEEELMLHRVLREFTLLGDPKYKRPSETPPTPSV
mmetsp:Transcript_61294/g.145282  ORF Transcript_61294/g.145282 Transcript_61294/m.145282 type:complete len:212 (-) Transcript_61294:111-746(-)